MKKKKVEALRYNKGKLRWSMMDFKSVEDMIRVLEFGAKKYHRDNWRLGLKYTEVIDSLMRHLNEIMAGNDTDEETGLPHAAHIMCNSMFLSSMMRDKPDFDDRYYRKGRADYRCNSCDKNVTSDLVFLHEAISTSESLKNKSKNDEETR